MECVSFQSRLISSVAYYGMAARLTVWFRSGRCKVHENVSEAVFRNFVTADSPGFYYTNYIAGNGQPYQSGPARRRHLMASLAISVLLLSMSDFKGPTAGEPAAPASLSPHIDR